MSGVSNYNAIVEQVYDIINGNYATYTEGTPGPISIRQLGASVVFEGCNKQPLANDQDRHHVILLVNTYLELTYIHIHMYAYMYA
jgi:hypothetical protein